jgi:beta-galactosidase
MGLAHCALDISLLSTARSQVKLTAELLQGAIAIQHAAREVNIDAGLSGVPVKFDLKAPVLWSPELPNLYTLKIKLESSSGEDQFSSETGIRELKINGDKFFLNGQPLVLRGVCRHDIWENQGHTLTQAQIEQDMRMIKAMGANFVRLVHYPHDRRVVEAASRIGLLVTEESGLVWVDFRKLSRETIKSGLQNLERTVRRDWNSPALFAVLLANESAPTVEVTQEACRRIRSLAPRLFLSTARADSPEVGSFEASKRIFDAGGLDFYTYHPYDFDAGIFEKTVLGFPGKPLVLTEWGGGVGSSVDEGEHREIGRLVESGRLAGHSYWSGLTCPSSAGEVAKWRMASSLGVVTENHIPRADVYLSSLSLSTRSGSQA